MMSMCKWKMIVSEINRGCVETTVGCICIDWHCTHLTCLAHCSRASAWYWRHVTQLPCSWLFFSSIDRRTWYPESKATDDVTKAIFTPGETARVSVILCRKFDCLSMIVLEEGLCDTNAVTDTDTSSNMRSFIVGWRNRCNEHHLQAASRGVRGRWWGRDDGDGAFFFFRYERVYQINEPRYCPIKNAMPPLISRCNNKK